jgi:hypothetical protein
MRIWRRIVGACGAAGIACAMAACAREPCHSSDTACLHSAMSGHAVRNMAFWQADRAKPAAQRLGPAPPQLVEYLTLDSVLNGYPERPRAATPDAAFTEDMKAAIAELPAEVWALFGQRLVGIYLLEDLGGTGYTETVRGPDKAPAAGLIVLDAAVLAAHRANAWATWKENTPFKSRDGYRLHARIEADADDNRKNAIQYILLHELGHVLSIGGNIHPAWNLDPKDVPAASRYPFFDLSWKIDRDADKYVTLFDGEFVQRKSTAYYFGAKLDAADMEPTYANLEKTNFPSLYAATRPGDDFAEAFASYVHVVLQKRPWEITISRDGQVVKTFKSCWEEARCAEKRRILEQLLPRR